LIHGKGLGHDRRFLSPKVTIFFAERQKRKGRGRNGVVVVVKRAALSPELFNEFFCKDPTKPYLETKKS
jgi:hypothetical protein